MKRIVRFVHAFPNSWFPQPGKNLVLKGISAEKLAEICKDADQVISHIRYDDHCDRVSRELGVSLEASMKNAPSPFECDEMIVVASLSPGSTEVTYLIVYDATAVMDEAGIL